MDCSLSAKPVSGNLDNKLSGNYCCGLEHFGIYLCGVFDFFSLCFTMEGAQEMFNGQTCLGCSLISVFLSAKYKSTAF